MPQFIKSNKHIIVIDDDNIILEIYDFVTKDNYHRIGSKKLKYVKNNLFPRENYPGIYFDDLNKLKENYNIDANIDISRSGIYQTYHPNKQIEKEFFHVNYNKEGVYKEFYPDGTLYIETTYINNKINGLYKEFDKCCIIDYEFNYVNGVLHGDFTINSRSYIIHGNFCYDTLIHYNKYYKNDNDSSNYSELENDKIYIDSDNKYIFESYKYVRAQYPKLLLNKKLEVRIEYCKKVPYFIMRYNKYNL